MRVRHRWIVTMVVIAALATGSAVAWRQVYGVGDDGRKVQQAFADELAETFLDTSFLVEAEGTCPVGGSQAMRLAPITLMPVQGIAGSSVVERVRQAIGGQHGVAVRQLANGVVLIRWPNVGETPFRTRLSHVELGDFGRYNAANAIEWIEASKEFKAERRRLRKRSYFRVVDRLVQAPMPGRPHLPGSLDDMTVDEAFIDILKTFHGTIVYSECSPWFRSGHYMLDYYGPPQSNSGI